VIEGLVLPNHTFALKQLVDFASRGALDAVVYFREQHVGERRPREETCAIRATSSRVSGGDIHRPFVANVTK
jgi:hypothetical protein